MTTPVIVVGVDSSDESRAALRQSMTLARARGARIELVHAGEVYDASPDETWLNASATAMYREQLKQRQAKLHTELAELREAYKGQGVDISVNMLSGFADAAICKAAEEFEAELVCVGSHGRTGVQRFFLGSVAERVVRTCHADVLVARGRKLEGRLFQSITVGVDFSTIGRLAIDRATELVDDGGRITLVHAWYLPIVGAAEASANDLGEVAAAIESNADEQIGKLKSELEAKNIQVESKVVYGRAYDVICDAAADSDLVCVGSHGRRGFRRLILGSVAERTVRHAPCSVYVAHGAAA